MPKAPPFRRLTLALVLLFGLAILVLSVLPVSRVALGTRPPPRANAAARERANRVHIAVHIGVFGAIACAAWIAAATVSATPEYAALNKMIGLTLTMLLGCGTEYLQHRVYRNSLEINDVFINLVSISAVFVILALIDRYRQWAQFTRPLSTADVAEQENSALSA